MTDNNHAITPPPELVQHWLGNYFGCVVSGELSPSENFLATEAARWGYEQRAANNEAELQKARDEELDACCEWLDDFLWVVQPNHQVHPMVPKGAQLRKHRRPKPPSLKEQALEALDDAVLRGDCITVSDALPTIRRALEQLDD